MVDIKLKVPACPAGRKSKKVKVKICGITNLEDARAAVGAGCDALGFVFYKKSPRHILPQGAKEIIRLLPKRILKVGVFVNAQANRIKYIAKFCKLDILQFHGKESVEFCRQFDSYKVIKAFRVKDSLDLEKILSYKTFAYLFDTFVKSKAGGTGKRFNWNLLKKIDQRNTPVFLSGGLTARNVARAIESAKPDWVDVSSSIESMPGKKDSRKIIEFLKAVIISKQKED